ncbi:hypothetical protein [Lysinibacillus sp. NPDC056185]|uniref:hypothetical protein n=1 Tax=Lysinibacillus sp. NPDC056185 TaxID=3345739 RepID=UPI0039F05FAB
MFKSKIAKMVGSLALSGAILIPSVSASAWTEYVYVKDLYPDAVDFIFVNNGSNDKYVIVQERGYDGRIYETKVKCDKMIGNKCQVAVER